jgi:hypothetical protein
MNRLEDIPKQDPFPAPEGYFDRLPGKIQARIAAPRRAAGFYWLRAVRLAVPILALAAVGLFWYRQPGAQTVEEQLSRVQPEQLWLFLEDEALTTEDLIESIHWNETDLQALEEQVYKTFADGAGDWHRLLDELGIEK